MLIRFSVANFLSFKDEVEFSMIPGKSRKHSEHIHSNGKRSSVKVLRAAVIYGANASGKSNLVKAMHFARQMIVEGRRPNQPILVTPFKFDAACANKPSSFQFEFKSKSKSFIYGFTVDTERIHEEWLYEITPSAEKPIFERKTTANGKTEVKFSNIKYEGAQDREFLKFTARGTRPNQLFLTESMERNIAYFEDAFNWFAKVLALIFPQSYRVGLAGDLMLSEEFKQSLEDLLRFLDIGISRIDFRPFNFDAETHIPEDFKSRLKDEMLAHTETGVEIVIREKGRHFLISMNKQNEIKSFELMTVHQVKGEDHRAVFLDVSEESDGTQRLFDLIPALMALLVGERVFIIDELDRSLHPHLSYKILELFLTNKPKQMSQLIVTTHESSLLDLDLLRRDEIWFVEKNADGASSVYSLEEFAPRYDKDIQKGYLLGRFGAIPFLKNANNLNWAK